MLAADALVQDEGTYKPDFSAHAGSEHMRCVRISKASVDMVTSLSRQTDAHETQEISSEVKVDVVDISESNGGDITWSFGNGGALNESDRKSPGPGVNLLE